METWQHCRWNRSQSEALAESSGWAATHDAVSQTHNPTRSLPFIHFTAIDRRALTDTDHGAHRQQDEAIKWASHKDHLALRQN